MMKAPSFLLALAIAATALAEPPIDQAPPGGPTETKAKPMCRSVPQTGTRFSRRVCRSVAEWREVDRHTINGEGFPGLGAGGRQQDTSRFGPAGRP